MQLRRLTAVHILRIAAAPLLFWYGKHHLLPKLFVDRAAWGEVAAGLLALLAVTVWQRTSGYWLAHLFGMGDFLVAFGTAIVLTRQDPSAGHAVNGLPMALIPFFGVGLLATTPRHGIPPAPAQAVRTEQSRLRPPKPAGGQMNQTALRPADQVL